jgi:hypothetical protein
MCHADGRPSKAQGYSIPALPGLGLSLLTSSASVHHPGVLVRLIDDFLYITTNATMAKRLGAHHSLP